MIAQELADECERVHLAGDTGIVLFPDGNDTSRAETIASLLQRARIETFLVALETPEEAAIDPASAHPRADIRELAHCLISLTDRLLDAPGANHVSVGYFGTGVGAAAALWAAAHRPGAVDAIVTFDGRADLALPALGCVRAPTLLMVGSRSHALIDLNRFARSHMHCLRRLEIVPDGAEVVATLSRDWFTRYLCPSPL